jgi:hypothetical protein
MKSTYITSKARNSVTQSLSSLTTLEPIYDPFPRAYSGNVWRKIMHSFSVPPLVPISLCDLGTRLRCSMLGLNLFPSLSFSIA